MIEELRRLERGAVDDFVRSTIDRVYSLLYGILRHKQEAEDATQEVYMRAWKALPNYRGDAAPETWIYRIAINYGRDAIARRQKERKHAGGEVDENITGREGATEERLMLLEALSTLSEDRRLLVLAVDVEGFSIEEAAEIFELPEGTIKSRLHRTREMLRAALKIGGTP